GQPPQPFPEPDGVALAAAGQGDVGQAGVLAGEGPRGLAVPGQVDGRERFAHDALLYDTGAGRAPQMSAAYSAMVRALENLPEQATLMTALRAQPSRSAYSAPTRSWVWT